MELIYLYVKNYNNNKYVDYKNNNGFSIVNTGFNFSNNFKCHLDNDNNLIIEKIDYKFKNFYSKNIKNLTLLAGRNGSGKTTVLDLIGMLRDERIEDHFIRKKEEINKSIPYFTSEYFFIYHMDNDEFLIEVVGNFYKDNEFWIKNLDRSSIFNGNTYKHYKIPIGYTIKYDYKNKRIKALNQSCFNEYKSDDKICDMINIYYFSKAFSHRKSKINNKSKSRVNKDDDYLIKRQSLGLGLEEPLDYISLCEIFFLDEYQDFKNEVIKNELTVYIKNRYNDMYEKNFSYGSSDVKEELKIEFNQIKDMLFKHNVSDKKNKENINLSNKQKYILNLTRKHILDLLNQFLDTIDDNQIYLDIKNIELIEKTKNLDNTKEKEILKYINFLNNDDFDLSKIMKNDLNLFKLDKNLFNEINDLKVFIKKIYLYEDKLEVLSFLEKDESKFENIIRKNIIINRYILLKLSSKYDLEELKEDKSACKEYQDAFEIILEKISKLEEYYFSTTDIVISKNISNNMTELFKQINEFYKIANYGYYNNISNKFIFQIPNLSDGERFILDTFSKLINIIKNEERKLYIIVMDEPDQRLHPEWARKFLSFFINTIESLYKNNYKINNKELNIQLVMSTHSPFLLSDIKSDDLILLNNINKNTLNIEDGNIKTFCANIHDILKESFFLDDSIGAFAKQKISDECNKIYLELDKEEYLKKFNEENKKEKIKEKLNKFEKFIDEIQEPIIKKSLKREVEIRRKWINESKDEKQNREVNNLIEGFFNMDKNHQIEFIKVLNKQILSNDKDK